MKPRVFIGSSVENLEIAYQLQSNLDYDGSITVWDQGVFNLSSNALNDLLAALDNFDFGIFVFRPEDVVEIREKRVPAVRDNIIFELGLFIGRLGKDRVFYLTPRSATDLHLPTDLIGLSSGKYDDQREDNNLLAALGPFCQQIRQRLKTFILENISDLSNETLLARKIATERPRAWEFRLAVELLETKLKPINQSYAELDRGLLIQKKVSINHKELFKFYREAIATYESFCHVLVNGTNELTASFGPLGTPGNALDIKLSVERLVLICKELFSWEYTLSSFDVNEDLLPIKKRMQGWSKVFVDEINRLPESIKKVYDGSTDRNERMQITIKSPDGMVEIVEMFKQLVAEKQNKQFRPCILGRCKKLKLLIASLIIIANTRLFDIQ